VQNRIRSTGKFIHEKNRIRKGGKGKRNWLLDKKMSLGVQLPSQDAGDI